MAEEKESKPAVEEEKTEEVKVEETQETAEEAKEEIIEELGKAEVLEEAKEETKKEVKDGFDKEGWAPKTSIGKKVKAGDITKIDELLDNGFKILEAAIVDVLIPDLQSDLLLIGQSKGKFGGGQRRVFKQTQKKTREGNKPKFATMACVGNENGYVGIGYGKSKETVPAREKAIKNAKLNIMKTRRGCGSWECGCGEPHSIPFEVDGKCGSCVIELKPAPKGTGLCIEKECAKILKLAGIKDVWSKTFGHTATKTNLIVACVEALNKLTSTKINPEHIQNCGIVEGGITVKDEVENE